MVARKLWGPVFQHTDQASGAEVRLDLIFHHKTETESGDRGAYDHREGELLLDPHPHLIGDRWQEFVDRVVKDRRYGSASEVVREGLRLVEEREARLLALRATLDASIAQGGEVTDEELDAALAAKSAELRSRGYGA